MREKTNGIVLSLIAYNDKSSFVHIYTEKFGRVTYAVPNVRSKRTRLNRSLFAPFSLLEMEVEHTPGRDIHKISEARILTPHISIPLDPVKNAVVLFLAECVTRTVREQEQNSSLFHFIADSINLYDMLEAGKANFHLVFLLRLSEYLGFRINRESYADDSFFDMMEGSFCRMRPEHPWILEKAEAAALHTVLQMTYANMADYSFSREQRTLLLDRVILYFRLHLPELKEIHSLEVLKMLFS